MNLKEGKKIYPFFETYDLVFMNSINFEVIKSGHINQGGFYVQIF